MKKFMSIACVLVPLFFGCVVLETHIANEENFSRIIPIENKKTFLIFGEKFVLNQYSLKYINSPSTTTRAFVGRIETTTRRYIFYENQIPFYTVDIITSERIIQLNDRLTFTVDPNMFIRISNDSGLRQEFTIDLEGTSSYVIFNDDTIGEVNFFSYRSRNKNALASEFEFLTGFEIHINNQEYGILAFYPPASLYLRNGIEIDSRMAMYILATYASFLYNEYIRLL